MPYRRWLLALAVLPFFARPAMAQIENVPRYDHIFLIIAENHSYHQIIGSPSAPNLNALAKTYGSASTYYGVVHPSKANYIAMIAGDTFGIHDDDAYYCTENSKKPHCDEADTLRPYVDHTVTARSLLDQLREAGLTWKGYFESIPEPGSKAVYYPDEDAPVPGQPVQLYASKHNAFINFASVQNDPDIAKKIVGLDQLFADLASGKLPNYAHIVPNQCNEMHGLFGANVPADCLYANDTARIARGDAVIADLVKKIVNADFWKEAGNSAIVITWDENDNVLDKTGCCGTDPNSVANFGGGRIPTIVITNHGPRGLVDNTPYNHYSLLRTTEAAFGISEFLNHAGDADKGVRTMWQLFEVK